MNKLTVLIEAAKAATPGPWSSYKAIVEFPQQEAGGFSLSGCPRAHENAEFIALVNPATIKDLCALLEKAEEALLKVRMLAAYEDAMYLIEIHETSRRAIAAIRQFKEPEMSEASKD